VSGPDGSVADPLVIHWSEWIASSGNVKVACAEDTSAIQLLLSDGQSGIDSEGRAFVMEVDRVTCLDCKALVAEALGGGR